MDVLRQGKKIRLSIHLKPDGYFSLSGRLARLLKSTGFRVGQKMKSEN
jgi:hypothetical protein